VIDVETRRIVAVLLVGLVVLSGCQGIATDGTQTSTESPLVTPPGDGEVGPLPWSVAVVLTEIDLTGSNFSGFVSTQGYYHEGVNGVRVEFRDRDHAVLRAVMLGNITTGRTDSFNVSLDTRPKYVLVRFKSKDPGEGLVFGGTEGYEIYQNGSLYPYHLRNQSEYIYDG